MGGDRGMTNFEKREAALKMLTEEGINKGYAAPPVNRWLWRMGFDIPPLIFGRFWVNALILGVPFGITMGLMSFLPFLSPEDKTLTAFLFKICLSGLLFGVLMAFYYSHLRRKHHLPTWEEIK